MPEKTQREMIQETHDTVLVLSTKLPFMQEQITETADDVEELTKSHGRLKKNFWTLIGVLAGSGVIGSGIYGLLNGG